jgi:hypothetical protein
MGPVNPKSSMAVGSPDCFLMSVADVHQVEVLQLCAGLARRQGYKRPICRAPVPTIHPNNSPFSSRAKLQTTYTDFPSSLNTCSHIYSSRCISTNPPYCPSYSCWLQLCKCSLRPSNAVQTSATGPKISTTTALTTAQPTPSIQATKISLEVRPPELAQKPSGKQK